MSFARLSRKEQFASPVGVESYSKRPSGLKISQPHDALEHEADRIANEVMAGGAKSSWSPSRTGFGAPLQRKCSCGGSGGAAGECEECKKKEETLHRRAVDAATPAEAPPIVHDVLRSPGRPLDSATRAFFEPRFGHDFSRVRVHCDEGASRSARAVGALAYTVGQDIVFGAGQYSLDTKSGRTLLAHELTHVVQQGKQANTIRRFVPAEAETDVEEEQAEGEAEGGHGKHGMPPSPNSLQGRLDAHRKGETEENLKFELEQPSASVERGGSDSKDFLEEKPEVTETYQTNYGTLRIRYKPTVFHMLDALEFDVTRAKSNDDILDIYISYFKDSVAIFATRPPRVTPRFRTMADKISLFNIPPEGVDSDGKQRTTAFVNAVQRRTDIDAKLSTDSTLEAIIRGLVEFEAQQERLAAARIARVEGPCQVRQVPRKGGNKDHDDYATEVTGQALDFEVSTVNGPKCVFDGQDATTPTVVWEVKTRHEWSTPQGIATGIFNPKIQDALTNMESQMARCQAVAQRCGFVYKWAFENKSAADFMATLWRGRVTVVHRPRAGTGPG